MAKPMTNKLLSWQVSFVLFLVLAGTARARSQNRPAGYDWPQFGLNVASTSAPAGPTGINAQDVPELFRQQVKLDGTVDSSAIYLQGVTVKGARHDVFFVTTTYGKTIAVDANQDKILWEYTPPKYASWAGTAQITTSTPVADPDRQFIYAAAPDGTVQKLAVSDGHVLWRTPITLLPQREKIASPLRYFNGRIIAVTGGYVGDRPPYQGHVAILDAQTGKLVHVWNSLCSDRQGLLHPSSCQATRSAIWGRAGAVIDPATGDIFVATGNGPYNGKTNWGDSVIELNPDATQILGNYTPKDNARLYSADLDLGSTSPVLLGGRFLAQGGKSGLIQLLRRSAIAGATPHVGNEVQTVYAPSGAPLFTASAVWRHDGETWMFVASSGGTDAWVLQKGRLVAMWKNSNRGTSPVVAGGLLYVYNPNGGLRIYNAASGNIIAGLHCGSGHWNSPIVVKGKIALPVGNANEHATSGVLDIWSLPDPIN